MWYVPNLQVDEGSSDDAVGEVNTHHYIFQCYFEQRAKKCDLLSQQTFLSGNIFARLLVKAGSERDVNLLQGNFVYTFHMYDGK